MIKFLGYILSTRKRNLWLAQRRLHKMKQSGEFAYAAELYQFLVSHRSIMSIHQQRQVKFDARAHDIGEVVQALTAFHASVLSDDPGKKYFTRLPGWYAEPANVVDLVTFVVDDGYLLELNDVLETINTYLQEIRHAMTRDANVELVTYYQKKSRRLYQELIQLGEALL